MRTTLTKSLHTVTAVSRLAIYLDSMHPVRLRTEALVQRALGVLGQTGAWASDDPTIVACVEATRKGVAACQAMQKRPAVVNTKRAKKIIGLLASNSKATSLSG